MVSVVVAPVAFLSVMVLSAVGRLGILIVLLGNVLLKYAMLIWKNPVLLLLAVVAIHPAITVDAFGDSITEEPLPL